MATIKGQGDTAERLGITVPVLVTGSFSSPQFTPDLKGVAQETLEKALKDPDALRELLPGKRSQRGDLGGIVEKAKDLLKGFRPGR